MIETKRLVLRPWKEDDAKALYKYASDSEVGPAAGWSPHTSVEESREIIRTVFSYPETYAVVLKETSEAIGCCGIVPKGISAIADSEAGEAEIGYWIGKPYWGQGLIPEAVNALVKRCFDELGLSALWISYYDGNRKSQRVSEKCGFRYHHTIQDKETMSGEPRTAHISLLTRTDYRDPQQ